jgi:hypothetical protein
MTPVLSLATYAPSMATVFGVHDVRHDLSRLLNQPPVSLGYVDVRLLQLLDEPVPFTGRLGGQTWRIRRASSIRELAR